MRRRSFFLKLFLGNLLLVLTIVALGGAISYSFLNRHYRQAGEEDQHRLLDMARKHFEALWPRLQEDKSFVQEAKRLAPEGPLRLTVMDAEGNVLAESDPHAPEHMPSHLTRPEVLAASEGRDGSAERFSDTLGITFRYMAQPVRVERRVVGVVRLAMPVRTIAQEAAFLRQALVLADRKSVV